MNVKLVLVSKLQFPYKFTFVNSGRLASKMTGRLACKMTLREAGEFQLGIRCFALGVQYFSH